MFPENVSKLPSQFQETEQMSVSDFKNLKVILVGSVAQAISVCQVVTKLPEWMGSCHPANAEMGIKVNSKKKIIKKLFFIILQN